LSNACARMNGKRKIKRRRAREKDRKFCVQSGRTRETNRGVREQAGKKVRGVKNFLCGTEARGQVRPGIDSQRPNKGRAEGGRPKSPGLDQKVGEGSRPSRPHNNANHLNSNDVSWVGGSSKGVTEARIYKGRRGIFRKENEGASSEKRSESLLRKKKLFSIRGECDIRSSFFLRHVSKLQLSRRS